MATAFKTTVNFRGASIANAFIRIDEMTVLRIRNEANDGWDWRINALARVYATKAKADAPVFVSNPEGNHIDTLHVSFIWDRQAVPGLFNAVEAAVMALPEMTAATTEQD